MPGPRPRSLRLVHLTVFVLGGISLHRFVWVVFNWPDDARWPDTLSHAALVLVPLLPTLALALAAWMLARDLETEPPSSS